jgi:TorA maturation chaperone TorD
METLTRQEAIALSENDKTKARRFLDVQKKFIEEHLIRWIPYFCEKVIKETELPFYRTFAELTRRFINFEMQEMNLNGNVFDESV